MLITLRIMKLFAAVGIAFLGFVAPFRNLALTDNGLPSSITISSITWSPDGNLLATGHYAGFTRLWDIDTDEILFEFETSTQPIYEVAWSPDGSKVAGSNYEASVDIWDMNTGQIVSTFPTIQSASGLIWSLDGQRLIVGTPEPPTMLIWDLEAEEIVAEQDSSETGGVGQMAWKPDGSRLAVANLGGSVTILDAALFRRVARFQGPEPPPGSAGIPHGGEVTAVAWNPEGTLIASGSLNGSVRIWDIETGQMLHEFRGNYYPVMGSFTTLIWSVHFTPDGSELISVSADGTIRGWEVESGRSMFYTQENERISAAAWSPDGCRLAYGVNTSDRRNPDADENLYEILSFCEP